jgi:hypothetical protein
VGERYKRAVRAQKERGVGKRYKRAIRAHKRKLWESAKDLENI